MSRYYLVEGYGGCGKTTFVRLLEKYFVSKKEKVLVTHEPGGTSELGSQIRSWLLTNKKLPQTPITQLFLFLADRSFHMDQIVRPAIQTSHTVIQDRGFLSSIVYQGAEYGLGTDLVYNMHSDTALFSPLPNKVLLIDSDPSLCFERLKRRDNENPHNYNRIDLNKLIKRRQLYIDCAKKYIPEDKLIIVDNNSTIDNAFNYIISEIEKDFTC